MCDKDSSLGNVLGSLPRREPRVIFRRAEYKFPDREERLVSVFVFCVCSKYSYKCVFPENYFREHIATNLIFILTCST